MKVCILAPFRVLPQMSGAARRVLEICAALSSAGVSVTLLHAGTSGFFQHDFRVVGFPALENSFVTKHFPWSGALDTYLSSTNLALCHALIQLMEKIKIDILQLEGPWSILVAELANMIAGKVPTVYDSHNVESLSIRFSSSVGWMWPFSTILEKEAVKYSELVFCVSELDKTKMCSLYGLPDRKVTVVPNGVRNSDYRMESENQIRKRLHLPRHSKIVFFHGELGWKPNAQAAQTIVESIATRFERESQETVFLIAGPHPSREVLQRAKCRPNVRILGYVPNIAEYICAADVCVAPLTTGSGTKLKILEYFAAGKPVVATQKAVEGLAVADGIQGLFSDDIGEEFIRAIRVALVPEFSRKLGESARAFAERFEWSTIAKKIVEAYESVIHQQHKQV
jgi:glycosyltransferase involved in cell wall biosynthesis